MFTAWFCLHSLVWPKCYFILEFSWELSWTFMWPCGVMNIPAALPMELCLLYCLWDSGGLRPGCGSCHPVKDVPLCHPLMDHGHVKLPIWWILQLLCASPWGQTFSIFVPLLAVLGHWCFGSFFHPAAETAVNMPFWSTQCLKYNNSQPLWSYCLQYCYLLQGTGNPR